MKIAICGSMSFWKEMLEAAAALERAGHMVVLSESVHAMRDGQYVVASSIAEDAERKRAHNLIYKHYEKIRASDVALVLNYTKSGVEHYIGGNTFLEIGFAHVLGKKIFLLNPIPKIPLIESEVLGMQPIVLHGDLTKLV